MAKIQVFVDTNIIIEAFRTNCWTAMCQVYDIETVEKCIEEALTGNLNDPAHVTVDRDIFLSGLAARHQATKRDLAQITLNHPHCQGLDDGELHLLAWLYSQEQMPSARILVSTADKAAIVATEKLGWIDAVISLEQILQKSGVTRNQLKSLKRHYQSNWLNEIKSKIRFGIIP